MYLLIIACFIAKENQKNATAQNTVWGDDARFVQN
jgi:hypothetical protein